MANRSSRPGRTLLIFAVCIAVLYGLAALGGTWAPKLGLDLEGGTRITLTAAQKPSAQNLELARGIIDQRVNGSGVTESSVTTQGGRNIIVEIPGENAQDLVNQVKRTAQLRFRLVAYCPQVVANGSCQAAGSPQASNNPSTNPTQSPAPGDQNKTGKTGKTEKGKTGKVGKTDQGRKGKKSPDAEPRPRPAVGFDLVATKKDKDKAKPDRTDRTTAPSPTSGSTPSAPATVPASADKGASWTSDDIDKQLAWTKDVGTAWQLIFAASRCNDAGEALVPKFSLNMTEPPSPQRLSKLLKSPNLVRQVDNPDRPIVACNDQGVKTLMGPAIIEGTQLKSASAGQNQQSLSQWVVQLTFKGSATDTFARASEALIDSSQVAGGKYAGGQFAIVLDGEALSTPGFDGVIRDGKAQISGGFTQESAEALANNLKYGALPVKFKKDVSSQTIGPSLAGNQLSAGLIAGAVGLAIVMLYCLFYYRGLGIVVIASLFVAAIIIYAVVLVLATAAGFTLTLPGIAGLIVAVGITADSFIVYFERIRDEMRDGKSMRVAVQAGWPRARNTCLAADAVSFLAAVVLYIFAIGVVRGFAFALGVSTLIDVAVFFFFTHPMVQIFAGRRFFNSGHRFSGLSAETLGVDRIETDALAGGRA